MVSGDLGAQIESGRGAPRRGRVGPTPPPSAASAPPFSGSWPSEASIAGRCQRRSTFVVDANVLPPPPTTAASAARLLLRDRPGGSLPRQSDRHGRPDRLRPGLDNPVDPRRDQETGRPDGHDRDRRPRAAGVDLSGESVGTGSSWSTPASSPRLPLSGVDRPSPMATPTAMAAASTTRRDVGGAGRRLHGRRQRRLGRERRRRQLRRYVHPDRLRTVDRSAATQDGGRAGQRGRARHPDRQTPSATTPTPGWEAASSTRKST